MTRETMPSSTCSGSFVPEFAVPTYRPDPADPVLAGPQCVVGGCGHPAPGPGGCVPRTTPAG